MEVTAGLTQISYFPLSETEGSVCLLYLSTQFLLHKWRELSTIGNCLEFYFHWRKLLML